MLGGKITIKMKYKKWNVHMYTILGRQSFDDRNFQLRDLVFQTRSYNTRRVILEIVVI